MQKWEYLYCSIRRQYNAVDSINGESLQIQSYKPLASFLREKGDEGWELVAVGEGSYGNTIYFKRPK